MSPAIYSYKRVSTTKQTTGLSLELQIPKETLEELAHKHNLPISEEIFNDNGKSAYKGQHLKNELGSFIHRIKNKDIAEGSIIVVYSLDRLSRQDLGFAKQTYLDITNAGISIFSVLDNHLYQAHNSADEILSTIIFERANNESKTKSRRTLDTALRRVIDHQKGVRTNDGYSYLISLGNNPWWITNRSDKAVIEHPDNFDIAKDIHQKILAGDGTLKILDYLNQTYKPPKPKNKKANENIKRKNEWKFTTISKFHKNPALYGLKVTTFNGTTYELENYYPAIMTKSEWYALQSIKSKRTLAKGNRKKTSLISGYGKARCFHCNAVIAAGLCSDTNTTRFYCAGRRNLQNGCKGFNVKGRWLEKALLSYCTHEAMEFGNEDFDDSLLLAYQGERQDKVNSQKKISDALASGIAVDALIEQLKILQKDIDSLNSKIEAELEKQHTLDENRYDTNEIKNELYQWLALFEEVLDEENQELREQLRDEFLIKIIKLIQVAKLKSGGYVFIFNFNSGVTNFSFHNGKRGAKEQSKIFSGKIENGKILKRVFKTTSGSYIERVLEDYEEVITEGNTSRFIKTLKDSGKDVIMRGGKCYIAAPNKPKKYIEMI